MTDQDVRDLISKLMRLAYPRYRTEKSFTLGPITISWMKASHRYPEGQIIIQYRVWGAEWEICCDVREPGARIVSPILITGDPTEDMVWLKLKL